MRAWIDTLEGKAVTTPGDEPVGTLASLEIDTGSWTVLQIRVAVDGAVASQLGMKRPLLGRPRLDIPADRLSDASGHLRVAGGYDAVVQLANRQGQLQVDKMNALLPKPAERRNPEPVEPAGGAKAVDE